MRFRNAIISIVIFLVLGLALIWYATRPERVVEQFMSAKIANDYSRMYDLFNIRESQFINKKEFVRMYDEIAKERKSADVRDYKLIKKEKMKNDIIFTLQTCYNGIEKCVEEKIRLTNNKIDIGGLILNEIYVHVPKSCNLYINNCEVSKESIDKSFSNCERFYDVYKIRRIFAGEHAFKITGALIEDTTQVRDLVECDTVIFDDFSLNKKLRLEVLRKTEDLLDDVVRVINREQRLESLWLNRREYREVEMQVNKIQKTMKEGSIIKIKIDDLREDAVGVILNPDLTIRVGLEFEYAFYGDEYDYWYKYKKDRMVKKEAHGEFIASCTYEKGDVWLATLDMLNFYK